MEWPPTYPPPPPPPGPYTSAIPPWSVQFGVFYPLRLEVRRTWRCAPEERLDALADAMLAYFARCGWLVLDADREPAERERVHIAVRTGIEAHAEQLCRLSIDDELNAAASDVLAWFEACGLQVAKKRRSNTMQGGAYAGGWPEHWVPGPPMPRLPDLTLE